MRFPVLALLLVFTGCSELPLPDWARSDSNVSTSNASNTGGANVAAPADALGSCREQAIAMIKRDQTINQDIANQDTNTFLVQGAGDLERYLSEYNTKNRYERIVEDCMAARGYDAHNPDVKPVQQEGVPESTAAGTPQAAPGFAPVEPSGINPNLPTYP
jgi:hypothetical protein